MQQNTPLLETNHEGLPVLRVRITAARPASLLVRLPDGSKGIIPRREWAWDRRHKPDTSRWLEGTSHKAVLLGNRGHDDFKVLSFRELTNPWDSLEDELKVGESVIAEIVHIRDSFAFAQIKPGVSGIIYPKEMPLLPEELPADILSLGDKVFVQVSVLDIAQKKMELSINDALRSIEIGIEADKARLHALFQDRLITNLEATNIPKKQDDTDDQHEFDTMPLASPLHKVLLIDNDPMDRKNILAHLPQTPDLVVVEAASGREGIDLFQQMTDVQLVILDMGLSDNEHGVDVARKILAFKPEMHIIFTSTDFFGFSFIKPLEKETKRYFPFYTKLAVVEGEKSDTLLQEIIDLLHDGVVYRPKSAVARNQGAFIEQLEMNALLDNSLEGAMEQVLSTLVKSTFVDCAVVLKLDQDNEVFSLTAAYPNDQIGDLEAALDGMYYSQAKDVLEEQETIYAIEVTREQRHQRYRNFFKGIPFGCFYGIPIIQQGHPVQYGLFVLHRAADLTWDTILRIRNAANYCSVLADRDMMLQYMQRYEDRYFKGQMFLTFNHELRRMIEALEGIVEAGEFAAKNNDLQALKKQIGYLAASISDVNELTSSYSRIINDSLEQTDINEVVRKVVFQLSFTAKEQGDIKLATDLDENLPSIQINLQRVEQIVSNIVLNAIQHIVLNRLAVNEMNKIHGYELELRTGNTIWVKTIFDEGQQRCHIVVMDTGPGIPSYLKQKIFQAGISNRKEGQGLGLFISKNLAEAMKSSLSLVETIRFQGSTFAISLPIGAYLSPAQS